MFFPGPYRVPRAGFATKTVYTNTVGRTAYRGPWQFETLAREVLLDIAARQMGIDPIELRRRNVLRRDDLPYANPNGMPYDNISPLGDVRAGAGDPRLRRVPHRAGRGARGGPLPRRRHDQLRRAVDAGLRRVRHRSRDDPHRAVGRDQRVRRRRFEREQPRDDGRAAHRRRARRATSRTSTRSRATPRSPASAQAPAGAAARSMTAGAIRETSKILRERILAIAAHKLEAAVDDIELADSRASVRGTPSIGLSLRGARQRSRTSSRPRCRRACRPGSRRARATPPTPAIVWVNATHVCTCEVDVETGARDAAALHRERGLRPDDQPERRRGPDRGRRGAGHRRRAVRAPRVRRRRQPARDDVPRLPRADARPKCRPSSTDTSRRRAPVPAATRASAKAARSARRPRSSTRWPTRSHRSA